jgi:hypothetical protein
MTREWPNEAAGWFVYREDGGTLIAENVYKAPDAALIADAPAMLELLRRREWGPDAGFCEECGMHGAPGLKHDPSCAWGALLDKHGRAR